MKMNKKRPILRRAAIPAVLALLCTLFWFGKPNDFGLGRNMELLVNMMRELSLFYVDEVDPDQLMQDAAEGMTRNLDPYTEFLPEEQMSNFDLLTTGKYGGIGSMIRKKGDYVIFAQPYEGSPADRAGIRIGDKILSIDGKDAKGFTTEQVSSRLKGEPGSKVKVTVEHLDGTQQTAAIRRERIAIPGVPYAGWVADGIGYIRHSDFTEGCYEEMRAAIERLRTERPLKGLVLDYRSNGGGIMQEAVKILGMFVPKGTEVVSTKGRSEDSKQVFRTDTEPILADLPLTVLINGNSASAAEIVAGALQDLDRAVLIGQRSFGKGLVQSPRPLGYNAMLKLTTAKYYIPSGRCIQAIDYSSRDEKGAVKSVPDSLVREFRTRGGRKVYDGGGIMPDERIDPEYISRFAMTLYAMGYVDDFADLYFREHGMQRIDPRTFTLTDADYERFEQFMADKGVDVTLQGHDTPPRPQKQTALMTDEEALHALTMQCVGHNMELMSRLTGQRSFAQLLELARGETNWRRLRAYLGVFESYSLYLHIPQKVQTLAFLYELLMHREGDIRRQAAALLGEIIGGFHAGYAKERPAGSRPDPRTITDLDQWKLYLEKIIYPDHKLMPQHRRWIGYTLKFAVNSLLQHSAGREERFLSPLFAYYRHPEQVADTVAFQLLDTAAALPAAAYSRRHTALLLHFAQELSTHCLLYTSDAADE